MPEQPLWAPWRMAYIKGDDPVARADQGCFLCRAPEETDPLCLWHDDAVMVILNRFPYNPGHLLVAPREHRGDYSRLPDALAASLDRGVRRSVQALERGLEPDGFNVGINLGRPAGAGLPGHLHVHVVPRWGGDNNFMPVLADIHVVPEHLQATADKLRPVIEEVLSP